MCIYIYIYMHTYVCVYVYRKEFERPLHVGPLNCEFSESLAKEPFINTVLFQKYQAI